ncbi:unnamed protein product [Parascedosporium putredinis]|uniref:ubiquitinyl hydrolase 1 n=1 Tax=Parascedosporium putredinis TaxID=1442378 RepID=A0A9P1GYE3_9PEZI|nr:unnamed protein product [Parascedosporium putredinis]CAI7989911.1 unnamed protein product [Parascedosporium putredinis]
MSGGWNTIESDAGVFTYLLENLGVKDVQFEELLSLDPSYLSALHPVYGVIFLFKFPTDRPYAGASAPTMAPTTKPPPTASSSPTKPSKTLAAPRPSSASLCRHAPPDIRGEALSNSELIREDGEPDDAFHFIAYLPVNGKLYELDGLQPSPISHGDCDGTTEDFGAKVMDVLQRRIARYDASEIRFNLLAMVRDRRIAAREIGDLDTVEAEDRKREAWMFENALRRHNFVGFAGEVLKGVVKEKVAEGKFDSWVKDATAKREEEWLSMDKVRKKRKQQGGGDVEMAG